MSVPVATDFGTSTHPEIAPTGLHYSKAAGTEEGQARQEVKDEAKGATVHHLNPDASPQEKAASLNTAKAALAPIPNLPSLRGQEVKEFKKAGGAEMASDVGTKGSQVKTTTDLKTVLKQNGDDKKEPDAKSKDPSIPGALPEGETGSKLKELPDWYSVGWVGQDKTAMLHPEDRKNRSILSDFVSDQFYGQWYHNAGIIVFVAVATHFVTLFRGGFAALIIIIAIGANYYDTSITRTRRNARDDLSIEVAKKGLQSEVETAMWLNHFMQRFWLIYEPVLSATIIASVDQVLATSTPSFLDSLKLSTFTLGTKPPRIAHVRTFPDTEDDVVLMDYKIAFVPNDIQDLTHAEVARKVNPKIVLSIGIGMKPVTLVKDIVVEDIAFEGTMRIRLKLMNPFPHVQLVDLSFTEPPVIDFVPKPIGFDMSIIPGFKPFVMSQLHGTLAPMMYAPNTFTLNLEQMLSGAPIDTAVGVLALTVYNGRGMKATKLGGGAPDPYVSVSLSGRAELAKTQTKLSTSTPQWNETKYILLNSLSDTLMLTVKDWNEHRPDSVLGNASFDLKSLGEDGQQEGINSDVILDGKTRGTLKYDAIYYPVLKPKKLPDGTDEVVPETKTGVVRLVVHKAKDLDPRGQQINPFFKVTLNNALAHTSQTLKRTANPIWERAAEFLVTEKSSAVIGVQILDDNSIAADSPLGNVKIKLSDIIEANAKGVDQFPLNAAKSGKLYMTAEWKPVLMAGAINGAGAYTPPIGVVRLWFKRARDLKNVEAMTGGKSDPYARVLHSGIVVARTLVIDNNLDPEWDEIVYIEVHSPKDRYTVEVMDYQHLTKDRTLGIADLNVADLVAPGPDKKLKPWISTGKHARSETLKSDGRKTVKGSIEFEVEFFPCAHLKNVSFSEPESGGIKEEDETEAEAAGAPLSLDGPGRASMESLRSVKEDEGIVIPRSELITTQSGILVFQIVSGALTRKGARVEVLFDDGYWPAYSTEHARSPHAVWDEIGEAFIRELDYSQIIFKLNTAEKDTKEDVIASATIDMNHFLESALDKPTTFTLTDAQGGNRNTITVAAKYIPVEIEILPRESVNNSGSLRLELLDGKDLPAADRSGKSDPFCKLVLNGEEVFKSQTIKKTLQPVWNEVAHVSVFSRTAAKFFIEVYDWDRVGSDTYLGKAQIDLAALEPIEMKEVTLHLSDPKTGKQQGTVRIKMVFQPAFVIRARQGTSNFGGVGRVATSLGGGVGKIGHGLGAVGHGVGHGVGAVGGGVLGAGGAVIGAGAGGVGSVGKGLAKGLGFGKRKDTSGTNGASNHVATASNGSIVNPTDGEVPPVPAVPYAVAGDVLPPVDTSAPGSPAVRNGERSRTSSNAAAMNSGGAGQLAVKIVDLSGHSTDEKVSVSLRHNGRTVDTTHSQKGNPAVYDQTFNVKTAEGICSLDFNAFHHKTIGKDVDFGSASVNLWDHISPLTSPTKSIQLPLVGPGGSGQLNVTLSWTPSTRSSTMADDNRSVTASVASPSVKSKSRFSRISMARSPKVAQE